MHPTNGSDVISVHTQAERQQAATTDPQLAGLAEADPDSGPVCTWEPRTVISADGRTVLTWTDDHPTRNGPGWWTPIRIATATAAAAGILGALCGANGWLPI
jgi:hypothetical protein